VSRSEAVADALLNRAVELAADRGVRYLEVRDHSQTFDPPGLPDAMSAKVRMVLDLPSIPPQGEGADAGRFESAKEAVLASLKSKVRSQVRKGDQNDFAVTFAGEESLNAFYDIFARNMHDLGTPVYGKALFREILRHLPGQAEFVVVTHAGTPAAAALLIHDSGNDHRPAYTQVPSASCLSEFNKFNTNMWMYWQLIARAIERGSQQFDFGRSSEGSGTYKFKKQWGALPQPTTWRYHLREGSLSDMRPDNPSNQRKVELWKKLPVWLTRLAGPTIVRGIP